MIIRVQIDDYHGCIECDALTPEVALDPSLRGSVHHTALQIELGRALSQIVVGWAKAKTQASVPPAPGPVLPAELTHPAARLAAGAFATERKSSNDCGPGCRGQSCICRE